MAFLYAEYLGFAAATLTTIAFIPQLIKAWKTKQTKDLSSVMLCVLNLGILLWLVYGIMINSLPIILANVVTFVLAAVILVLKMKYQ